MIVYEPNKHFLSDIRHLASSRRMVKILRAVFAMGCYTLAVCIAALYNPHLKTMDMDISIFSFLEIVLSVLLVFRTNNSNDCWWEGRKQWGALVNNCRHLAILVHTSFPRPKRELSKTANNTRSDDGPKPLA